jgi:hypothetical protein
MKTPSKKTSQSKVAARTSDFFEAVLLDFDNVPHLKKWMKQFHKKEKKQ